MPFSIVQTTSAAGRKELSAVPEQWIDKSAQGEVLLWPNVKSSADQVRFQQDENSAPGKSWLKYKCRVKRKHIPTFAQAAVVIDEMSGNSSSDASVILKKKKRHGNTAPANFQHLLNLPIEASSQNSVQPATSIFPTSSRTAQLSSTVQPIIVPAAADLNLPYVDCNISGINFPEPLTIIENTQSTLQNSVQQCLDLLKTLVQMQRASDKTLDGRISSLEKRVAHQSTQIDFILDAIKCRNCQGGAAEGQSFIFEPVDDSRKLDDLEKNLEDSTFKSNLMRWLRIHVSSDCADDRLICVLDLLMTKKLQAQCTWTGSSRKGAKIPIMVHRKMLKVFEEIGNSDVEKVTQDKLAKFFMRRLKNATKRLETSGIRRSTHHVIKKRKPREATADPRIDEQAVVDANVQAAGRISNETEKNVVTENFIYNPLESLVEGAESQEDVDSVSSDETCFVKEEHLNEGTASDESVSDTNVSGTSE